MAFEQIVLTGGNAGSQYTLNVHRFGNKIGPKVYIQAGLHADEHPGMLVAQKLISQLAVLEQQQCIHGEIIVVPIANPIGLAQRAFGHVIGRLDLHTGQNFNRGMGIPTSLLNDQLMALLQPEQSEQADVIMRQWLRATIQQREARYDIEHLHKAILSLSIDANIVLDLHCDHVALPHIFYGKHQIEQGQRLANALGFGICLEEDVTGTVAFDGTHTQPWVLMEKALGHNPFQQPCFAATIELRGQSDVSNELADNDCRGILNFLIQENIISTGYFEHQPSNMPISRHGVEQVKIIASPGCGIMTYTLPLGAYVYKGDCIGELVQLDCAAPSSIKIEAPCDGILFGQIDIFYVSHGQTLAMIASQEQHNIPGTQLAF